MPTTTSNTNQLTNTPQAGDDYYSWTEDQLLASGLLSQYDAGHLQVVRLNVMSNDLGGNAKKLWSIDDGNGNTNVADYDLVNSDMQGIWECTASGNKMTILNGAILLDLNASLKALGAADVNGLTASDHIHEEFVYAIRLANGALSQANVTIDIWGQNDAASISGDTSGNLTEDATTPATGALTVVDPDHGQSHTHTASGAASDHGLGTYSVDADGHWSYTVSNAAVQHLNANETATDSFTVMSFDGTASQQVTIAITGSNDAAVIAGTASGSVVEAGGVANGAPGTPTASGILTDSDVDNPANTFQAVAAASDNHYGTYTVNASGHWSYTLDNNNSAVQALNAGDPLTDSFTVHTQDGTAQQVTIAITGSNDAAVIGGQDTGSVIEAGAGNNGGTPTAIGTLTVSDPDNGQSAFLAENNVATNYGHFTLNSSSGGWSYTLDNSNPTVNALNTGQQLHDLFNVSSVDGTIHQVDITINGTTDDLGPPTGIAFNFAVNPNLEGSSSLNANQLMGSFIATGDPDSGDTFAYALSGTGASHFSLTGAGALSTGSTNVTGSNPATLYSLTVTITDQAGNQFVAAPVQVAVGNSGDNVISLGTVAANIAYGLNGADTITGTAGFDAISGGQSTDTITGGGSGDYLVGGSQSDTFAYTAITDSQPGMASNNAPKYDTIVGFTPASNNADLIDFANITGLPTIDSNHTTAVQGLLASANTQVLAGHIAWFQDTVNNQTIVYANTSGSAENQGATNMEIHLVGIQALSAGDFHHV